MSVFPSGYYKPGSARYCAGCVHFKPLSNTGTQRACHYILDTGHRRPCLPGPGCTVREQRKRKRGTDR